MSYSILRTADQYINEVEMTSKDWPEERILQVLESQLGIVEHFGTMPMEERQKAKEYLSKRMEELKKG